MSDPNEPAGTPDSAIFSGPADEPSSRGLILTIVGVAVVAIFAGIFLLRGPDNASVTPPNTILPADPYAPALVFSQLAMSQSSSISGGTSTFLDGHILNSGPSTLTGITVQVLFRNDVGLTPQVESLPLSLIRTREPYIDTQPLTAAPLKPGAQADFRLIFEKVPENWNHQMPQIQVTHAAAQ